MSDLTQVDPRKSVLGKQQKMKMPCYTSKAGPAAELCVDERMSRRNREACGPSRGDL